jgi:hypothetical protein
MPRGKKHSINQEDLRYVAEKVLESGHVLNAISIARIAGVNKGTISRNLHALGIPFNGKKYEASKDNESRTHEEIARIIREELEKVPDLRKITSDELVVRCELNCSSQMVRKIMIKYAIPWRPAGRTPK